MAAALNDALPLLDYCCPRCQGDLTGLPTGYYCGACGQVYPVVLGIPDFRVFPDPYISLSDDRAKGQRILEEGKNLNFNGLVELYWKLTPGVPPTLARQYVAGAVGAVETGAALLAQFEKEASQVPFSLQNEPNLSCLEVGCGTGGFLVAAKDRYAELVGVDIAFRWLVIARQRLLEAGCKPQQVRLVCACAQALPFRTGRFDRVVAINTLEHADYAAQQEQLLVQVRRVLRPAGYLFLNTYNRYSLGPEPHMHLWGLGWLPRRWMNWYTQLRKGVRYQHIRLMGYRELQSQLEKVGLTRRLFLKPFVEAATLARLGFFQQKLARLYNLLLKTPLARLVLRRTGPFFRIIAQVGARD